MASPLNGLIGLGDNPGYAPKGRGPTPLSNVQVPQFTTDELNPMWAKWLDMAGASQPGGVRMQPPAALPESSAPVSQLAAYDPNEYAQWKAKQPGLAKRLGELA